MRSNGYLHDIDRTTGEKAKVKTAKKFGLLVVLPIILLIGGAAIYYYIKKTGPYYLPDITLEAIDGHPLALQTLRGKPSLVVFWASTCETCIKELPELIELYNHYSPKGLQVIGIVIYYNNPKEAIAMVQNKKIPYRILLDRDYKATYAFGNVQHTPTSFLISPDGKIVYRETGKTNFAAINKSLQNLLSAGY